jgi:anti-sigma-K factor RskA
MRNAMTDPFDRSSTERAADIALWRRYRQAAAPPAAAEPDFNLLAGYVERRLDAAAAEEVEGWLAQDPELAHALLGQALLDPASPDEPAPLPLIRAARDLVPARMVGTTRRLTSWNAVARWSSLAAAMMVAGVLAFQAGLDFPAGTESTEAPAVLDFGFTLMPGENDGIL